MGDGGEDGVGGAGRGRSEGGAVRPGPVPLQDPGREYRELREELDEAVLRVAASGRYVLGPEHEAFEAAFAETVGVRHAVGVASGTDALILALEALGVGPGDEVVTSPFTFFATAEAILRVGAVPVFADIRADTFDLDPAAAAAAIGPRTAALLPVHLYGQMAEVEAFRELAARHGLALVEDAAQAVGASRRLPDGRAVRAGAAGDVGCFSFYPTKNLGAWGDAGAVTTDDDALAARLRRLREHGREEDGYRHREIGHNSRLDEIQAAVLRVKLGALDRWTEARRANAATYDRELAGVADVETPVVLEGNRHVYHQYTIRCGDRARVAERLGAAGVGHGVYYPTPLHRLEALSPEAGGGPGRGARPAGAGAPGGRGAAEGARIAGELPRAERACREVLSVPVFPALTPEERARVVAAIRGQNGAEPG